MRVITSSILGLLLSSVSLLALPITVNNPSFETLPATGLGQSCGSGCSFSLAAAGIPGWTVGLVGGLFQPGSSGAIFNSVPNGVTTAYAEDGAITQTTSALVQLGVTYTLQVDIGLRKDKSAFGSAQLVIGGTNLILATGIAPTSGNWSTYTATYLGVAADVGKSIGISLNPSQQGNFDNVRLNDSTVGAPIPEPSTWALIGAGVLALAAKRRRTR